MNKQILKLLQQCELANHDFHWDRQGNNLVISTSGYKTQTHYNISTKLLKLGAKYSNAHDIERFDDVSGRTFTTFKNIYKG